MGLQHVRLFSQFVVLFAAVRMGHEISVLGFYAGEHGWGEARQIVHPREWVLMLIHVSLFVGAVGFLRRQDTGRLLMLAAALLGLGIVSYELTISEPVETARAAALELANVVGAVFYFGVLVAANSLAARTFYAVGVASDESE